MERRKELKEMICSQCGIHKSCIQVKDGGVCIGCWPDYFDANKDSRNTTPAAPDNEMLTNAIVKAVELGMLPKFGSEEEYLKIWDNMKAILQAALDAS